VIVRPAITGTASISTANTKTVFFIIRPFIVFSFCRVTHSAQFFGFYLSKTILTEKALKQDFYSEFPAGRKSRKINTLISLTYHPPFSPAGECHAVQPHAQVVIVQYQYQYQL
jgi:hypothetical protein